MMCIYVGEYVETLLRRQQFKNIKSTGLYRVRVYISMSRERVALIIT